MKKELIGGFVSRKQIKIQNSKNEGYKGKQPYRDYKNKKRK